MNDFKYTIEKRSICKSTNDYVFAILKDNKRIRDMIGTERMARIIANEKGWTITGKIIIKE